MVYAFGSLSPKSWHVNVCIEGTCAARDVTIAGGRAYALQRSSR